MNHDYANTSFTPRDYYYDAHPYETQTGWNSGPQDNVHAGIPLTAPDTGWDPVEELAYLLQEAVPAEQPATVPPPRSEAPPSPDFTHFTDFTDFTDPLASLAHLTAQLPPTGHPPTGHPPAGHRKMQTRKTRLKWVQTGSVALVALVAVIVAMVSVFGGMIAYRPLQHITSATDVGIAPSWPLLVYGPWMAGSLSILRAALHQRRAVHSWFIVLLFSSVATMLCVAQADKTLTGIAGAALPALASLACFQQLVRQITLTLPPRQATPRHRH